MRQCEFVVSHFLMAETKAWNEAEENAKGEKVNLGMMLCYRALVFKGTDSSCI